MKENTEGMSAVINFNELSDAAPEREKIRQLLAQEGASGSSFQEITLMLSDESLLDLQKLLVNAYYAAYNKGYEDGEENGYDTGYSAGWNAAYDEAVRIIRAIAFEYR